MKAKSEGILKVLELQHAHTHTHIHTHTHTHARTHTNTNAHTHTYTHIHTHTEIGLPVALTFMFGTKPFLICQQHGESCLRYCFSSENERFSLVSTLAVVFLPLPAAREEAKGERREEKGGRQSASNRQTRTHTHTHTPTHAHTHTHTHTTHSCEFLVAILACVRVHKKGKCQKKKNYTHNNKQQNHSTPSTHDVPPCNQCG